MIKTEPLKITKTIKNTTNQRATDTPRITFRPLFDINPWGNLKGGGTWTNPPTQASDDDDDAHDADDAADDDAEDDDDDDDDDDEINADTKRISSLKIYIDGNFFLIFFEKT